MPLELNGTLPLRKRQLQIGGHFTIKVASCHKLIQIQGRRDCFKVGWDKGLNSSQKFNFQTRFNYFSMKDRLLPKIGRYPHFNFERTIRQTKIEYCMLSIISRGLYTLNPLFEGQKHLFLRRFCLIILA
jgi:hypothetical protein